MTASDHIDELLARIRARDPGLCAFIEVDAQRARDAAAESARRIAAGAARPLEAMGVAIKANIDVAGLETSAGMAARRGMIASADADAVARLRAAGAVILGTLNMQEAALGADTDNPWFGRAFNPHGAGRTPGGSSGGSGAAVAAGLCDAALGTDTLGSVRIPAAYCGVYGLKPTHGAIPQHGLELAAAGLDTIGPLARDLDTIAALFHAMASPAPAQPISGIGLLAGLGGVTCEPGVLAGYQRTLAALRAEGFAPEDRLTLEAKAVRHAGFVHVSRELGDRLASLLAACPEGFSDSLKFLLDYGRKCSPDEVARSEVVLAETRTAVIAAVGDGALLLPTAPQAAFAQGGRAPSNQADFTSLASVAGLPALAIPAGTDGDGMPVGVQLIGAAGNEAGLIALAHRLEPHLGGAIAPPTN